AALLAPVAERARHPLAVFEQPGDGAFHVDINAQAHTAILECADHLQARAVTDVAEAFEGVAAEGALQDLTLLGAVKKRAPLLQLAYAVGRFLRMKLSHAPVVDQLSAAHRIAEVRAP